MAVVDALPEHAVVVANAVADDRQRQRRAAVEKTGGEPAQAAVAEAGILLAVVNVLQVEAKATEGLGGLTFDAEIQQGVSQQASHQVFERQVGDAAGIVANRCVARCGPAFHEPVARRVDDGLVEKR